MKKYRAFAVKGEIKSAPVTSFSKVGTLEEVTQWARTVVSKSEMMSVYVTEIISVVERPPATVIVKPFTPEPEVDTGLSKVVCRARATENP